MKRYLIILGIVAAVVLGTLASGPVVAQAETVFSVSVDGDVVRGKGRWRTNRRGVTHFRTRGITRADRGFGSCAGRDSGSCNGR